MVASSAVTIMAGGKSSWLVVRVCWIQVASTLLLESAEVAAQKARLREKTAVGAKSIGVPE
jgi:hypothetical protein